MDWVDLFDEQNWNGTVRLREAAGYFGNTTITLIEGIYRVRFGSPDTGGAERDFAELADAIEWANSDAGGVRLLLDDEGEIGTIEVFDDPATRPADALLGPSSVIDVSVSATQRGEERASGAPIPPLPPDDPIFSEGLQIVSPIRTTTFTPPSSKTPKAPQSKAPLGQESRRPVSRPGPETRA